LPDRISALRSKLMSMISHKGAPDCITKLAGDASTRSYYRAHYPDGDTVIVMAQAHPGLNEEEAFLEVQRFLHGLNLPVPRVLGHDKAEGLVFLEDLGDNLLETAVEGASRAQIALLYRSAVEILLRMRRSTFRSDSSCSAFRLAFDEDKLMWEMNFFVDHFIGDFCKIALSPGAGAALQEFFLKICRILAAEPRIFTHRDYHSRNLLLNNGRLFMIDFQDARMGPAQYDLASLLRDSYVTLPDGLLEEMLDFYTDDVGETSETERERFRYIFDVMSLQRNIKALGTFGYQVAVRGSKRYMSSIPRTGSYVMRNMVRYDEFARYRSVVEDYISAPALGVDIKY
jgi:N-acetylmuramate 1-kinase